MTVTRADGTVQLWSKIPKSLHRAIRLDALEHDETLATWVTEALEAHLERTKPGTPRRGAGE